MEIISPSFGLIVWSLLGLLSILLMIAAIYQLGKSKSEHSSIRILWLLFILFAPLIGSILYFTIGKKSLLTRRTYQRA